MEDRQVDQLTQKPAGLVSHRAGIPVVATSLNLGTRARCWDLVTLW
jgi:hypothetical protein